MAHHIPLTIIGILVIVLLLLVTGYITDPIIDGVAFSIIGYITYRTLYVVIKFRKRNIFSEIGKRAKALEDIKPGSYGYVLLDGEYWKAKALEDIKAGDEVIVIKRDGLTLYIKKVKEGVSEEESNENKGTL
ncbi:MAG: NfeD family protein [Sulfolobaceae archaeon]